MKRYSLILKRNGSEHETIFSNFWGYSDNDPVMLKQIKDYLQTWLERYNNSLTENDMNEIFKDFDGSLSYDIWSFKLINKYKYHIRNRISGDLIDYFETFEEALKTLNEYEKYDKNEDIYIPNFYEIYESEKESIIY